MCPFNRKFARELSEGSPFSPRAALAGRDARSLALSLLSMSQEEFASSFHGSPMKRAKLRGLRRNAAVVPGHVGSADDVPALAAALSDPEPIVRSHTAWALGRIGCSEAVESLRARAAEEPDVGVLAELRATPPLTRSAASVSAVSALYTWERHRGARERRAPD